MKEINDLDMVKVTSAAVTGTSFMTLFSYLVSKANNENFKEPQLLTTLFHRLVPQSNKQMAQIAGWGMHYSVGFMFAALYAKKWRAEKNKATIKSGVILGGLSGIFAIVVWRTVFAVHPAPPKTNFKKYYGHLLLAHLVFGAFTSIGYNLVKSNDKS